MSMEETPGFDQIRQLSKEYRDPVLVSGPKLLDVSFIEDPGMRAVVVLAVSLDWNMVHKANRVVTLIARNGFKQVIPTDTSIKFAVFQNRVYATVTHSFTHIPTPELMEKIIKQHKLDPSHARVFRDALSRMGVTPEPEEEAATTPVVADEFVPTERVEPTLSTAAKGLQYVSQIMETVIRKLVPEGDDQITYRCMVCGLEFPTKRAVGGHYGNHVAKGEAVAKPEARENVIRVTPTPVKEPEPEYDIDGDFDDDNEWREPEPEPEPTKDVSSTIEELLRSTVATIAMLVSEDRVKEVERERDEALAELQELQLRFNTLQQPLSTLYELLGELNPTNKEK